MITRQRAAATALLLAVVTGCGAPERIGGPEDGSEAVAEPAVADGGRTPGRPPALPPAGAVHASDADRSASLYTVVARATVPVVVARDGPGGESMAEFSHPTAVGGPLVFLAIDGSTDSTGRWLEVQLPIKPNGTTGWISVDDVSLFNNPYRVEIDRSRFSLRVHHGRELFLETTIAVGTGATPTPVGEFYLLELLAPPDPDGPYGPYAFGLSGFSEVLTSFGGADRAVIGLHGTNDPAALGTTVSHGCIRVDNAVIEQLAATLPLGTPVRIT